MSVSSLWERLVAFLFPACCLGCQAEMGKYLCSACLANLQPCHSLITGASLITLGRYEGFLAESLTAVKKRGHKALAKELSELAAMAIVQRWGREESWTVHAVRPSREGHRYRGFSIPQMMEKAVIESTGWQALEPSLAASFPGSLSSSRGLSLEQRLGRQSDSDISSSGKCQPRGPLLLLDDVVTTGATLGKAVSTARELGFEPVSCFALALAPELQ